MPLTAADRALLRNFGSAVRARREQLGISQERLADIAGLHRTYVGDVERGERNIALLNIVKLAEALHSAPGELLAAARGSAADE